MKLRLLVFAFAALAVTLAALPEERGTLDFIRPARRRRRRRRVTWSTRAR